MFTATAVQLPQPTCSGVNTHSRRCSQLGQFQL